MSKKMKLKFEELYIQNLQALLKDNKAVHEIEKRIDQRHMDRLND
ncbi:FbpB family small basic protein [Salipaludibacillus sp. LMS25]|jgi:hypothetical protein|nr:FbpB family small basic protein [Salipaludibacillus sp. LMS25]UTR14957.1 FbpB family small basic protein [Salipaludibacillus sp. LMS25]